VAAPKKKPRKPAHLTDLAKVLLSALAADPGRIEYNTRVLGGSFKEADIERLDAAYAELGRHRLVERAGPVVSFFGVPKPLYRITDGGRATAGNAA
jgi:hypothetical protein